MNDLKPYHFSVTYMSFGTEVNHRFATIRNLMDYLRYQGHTESAIISIFRREGWA